MTGSMGYQYRQCPECGSLDFVYRLNNIEEVPSMVKITCQNFRCLHIWTVKVGC